MLPLLVCAVLVNIATGNVLKEFSLGNAKFSAGVYREMLKINNESFLVCPISVETAMAMTGVGAKDNTALEIFRSLGLPEDQAKVEELFKTLIPKLKGNEHYALNTANRIFVNKGYTIKQSFKQVCDSVFKAGIENVEFAQNAQAAKIINDWVETKTNNKIKDLVSPDNLDADTRLVLVNAIHFKGKWIHQFESYATRQLPFYGLDGTSKDIDTMSGTHRYKYYENTELDAKFLEMPFEGNEIAMVIVLPNKKNGLPALEQQLEKVFAEQPYTYEQVAVQIPKFTVETTIQFKDILTNLGVKDAFDSAKANFSGISDDRLFIDRVVQKTFLNMTEGGVEAAAATAVFGLAGAGPQMPRLIEEFTADHPFLYILSQKTFNINLFVGKCAKL